MVLGQGLLGLGGPALTSATLPPLSMSMALPPSVGPLPLPGDGLLGMGLGLEGGLSLGPTAASHGAPWGAAHGRR